MAGTSQDTSTQDPSVRVRVERLLDSDPHDGLAPLD